MLELYVISNEQNTIFLAIDADEGRFTTTNTVFDFNAAIPDKVTAETVLKESKGLALLRNNGLEYVRKVTLSLVSIE